MRDFLCGLDWGHTGTWVYKDSLGYNSRARTRGCPLLRACSQTRICLRCGKQSYRFEHEVEHWTSNGWFSDKQSGICIRCKERQTRWDPDSAG